MIKAQVTERAYKSIISAQMFELLLNENVENLFHYLTNGTDHNRLINQLLTIVFILTSGQHETTDEHYVELCKRLKETGSNSVMHGTIN